MSSLNMIPLTALGRLKMEAAHNMELRNRFLSEPAEVLREAGIDIVENPDIEVIEDTRDKHHIVLPPFVGTDPAPQEPGGPGGNPVTWWCTTCTPTSPICAGSLASLTCV